MNSENRGWLLPALAVSWGEIPIMPVVEEPPLEEGHRCIVMIDGRLHQIPDHLIGEGLKPLVFRQGKIAEFSPDWFFDGLGDLGQHLIFLDGKLQTLPPGESIVF